MSSEAITRNDLKAVLDEVLPLKSSEWEEVTSLTVTVTTGSNSQTLKAYTNGSLIFFSLNNIERAATTSAGSNLWAANIGGLPSAFINACAVSYYGSSAIITAFKSTSATTATIKARVVGSSMSAGQYVDALAVMTMCI